MPLLQAESSPYIGSRYFERTEADCKRFFGRDREVEELSALIIAHNVVVVYAPSGAGKTSLLNAGVIPKLERGGLEVLPRGRVRVALPPEIVLDDATNPYVLNLLVSLSPEADITSLVHRTLVDHLCGLPRPAGTTGRALVIDQAEELFSYTPPNWQAHQREFFIALGEALRDEPDLRAVMVLREDYVARLDDFAGLVPGRLRVHFHLEPLSRDAARRAVEGPLAGTGWVFGEGVADQLVADLSKVKLATGSGAAREEPGPYVEPVQLQVVCEALWRNLPDAPKRDQAQVITAEHLQRFGDVEDTLERFYQETVDACVEKTGCDRERIARWFGEQLITPADTRGQVFRGPDDTEGLPNKAVDFLESKRLIHADERASGQWYELAHDRLVRPVRAVNKRWSVAFDAARARLQRRRRARRIALFVGPIVASMLVATGWIIVEERRAEEAMQQGKVDRALRDARRLARERALTGDRVAELRKRCTQRTEDCRAETERVFDSITDYYWRQGQGKTEQLTSLLKAAADLIPSDYGMPAPGSARTVSDAMQPDLLQVKYHPARRVDEWRLRHEWAQMALRLGWDWGLPAVPRIMLAPDIRVPVSSVQIAASPQSCASATRENLASAVVMPAREGEALISRLELAMDTRLSQFFDEHSQKGGWKEYRELQLGGPWWFVPAWTLPIWRVNGHPAVSREAILSVVVANQLLHHPEMILGCDALKVMLQRAAEVAPESVSEALSARTLEGLRHDLVELVRGQSQSLRHLPTLLDALANYPDVNTVIAASFAAKEQSVLDSIDAPLHGPWRVRVSFDAKKLAPQGLHKELVDDFPAVEAPIRVEIGAAIRPAIAEGDLLREDILQRLSALRGDLYLKYGVVAPRVRFRDAPALQGLRIVVLNQNARNLETREIEVSSQEAVQRLSTELATRYRALRGWWLTAEAIQRALTDLPDHQRAWLDRHYNLTDLKRLARAVVADDGTGDGADTLRDLRWLFGSLVFWSRAYPGDVSVATLAAALRDTQRARMQPPARAYDGDSPVTGRLRRGLAALDADRTDEAEAQLAMAIRLDRDAAIDAFLGLYPALSSLAPDRRVRQLLASCRLPDPDTTRIAPSAAVAYEVEDVLANDVTIAAAGRRKLELCLLWSIADDTTRPREVRTRAASLVIGSPVDAWTRGEALFLAQRWLLSNHQQAAPIPDEVSAVRQLLSHGLAGLRTQEAIDLVSRRLTESIGTNPWRWIRDLVADVAHDLSGTWPSLKLNLAHWLTGFGEIDAKRALALIGASDPGQTSLQKWNRAWVGAKIFSRLGEYGDMTQRAPWLDEAAAAFRDLAAHAPTPYTAGQAFAELAGVHAKRGDVRSTREAIRDGIARSHQPALFDVPSFFVELGEADTQRAAAIDAQMMRRAPDDIATLFIHALFTTLMRRADFEDAARNFIFHDTKHLHANADYIRFLLFWALSEQGRDGDARQVIDERMAEIRRDSWKQRLEQRDSMVWREMLVALFAGQLPEAEVFGPLRDEAAFHASGLDQTELSLNGLRCEAYFYTALRERVTGDPATREARFRERLNRVLEVQEYGYYEHRMAQFLLNHIVI